MQAKRVLRMSFFKNKHVITAMIVSPILAVLAYFAVDLVVKEKPHVAAAGQAYPLVAKSNCRFTSGKCDLENASFKSQLSVDDKQRVLKLTSSHALEKAAVGFVAEDGTEILPARMSPIDNTNTSWRLELPSNANSDSLARVALIANDVFYFAETTMQFSAYETTFDKDFRKNK